MFRGLSQGSIRTILERASTQDYPARHWLFRQGEPARNFYVLKSGLLSLSGISYTGEQTLIQFKLPGEATGYVALSELDRYALSAQTLRTSSLLVWDRQTALRLIAEIPQAAANLLGSIIGDVAHSLLFVHRLRTDPMEKRIEWGLRELGRVFGSATPEGLVIEYPGHQELAELAGTNIYNVSRELSKLEARGVLRKKHGYIVLLASDTADGVGVIKLHAP